MRQSKFKVGDRVILRRINNYVEVTVHGEILRRTHYNSGLTWDIEGPAGTYFSCSPSTLSFEEPLVELSRTLETSDG